MKKLLLLVLTVALAFCTVACGPGGEDSAEIIRLKITCESENIYQLYYTYYINGEYRGQGGMADLDGNGIAPDQPMELVFTKSSFDEGDDPAEFSIDFSPYGKDDTSEIATTDPVPIHAEFGGTYTILFSGDRENGFQARLQD